MNTNPTERLFQEWAERDHWTVTKSGWPDFLCWRSGEFMAVEVKWSTGLTDDQKFALATLHSVGVPTFVWTEHHGLSPYPRPQTHERVDTAHLLVEIGDLRRKVEDLELQNRALRKSLTGERSRYLNDGRTRQISRMTRDIRALAAHARNGRPPADVRRLIERYQQEESR